MVVAVVETEVEPLAEMEVKLPGEIAMAVAPLVAQVSVLLAPEVIVAGLALKEVMTGSVGPAGLGLGLEPLVAPVQPEMASARMAERGNAMHVRNRCIHEVYWPKLCEEYCL